MYREEILKNRDDLIEGTFCYELFELQIFNEKLFFELVNHINEYLSIKQNNGERPDNEIISFLSWFVTGVMHCVICHNDMNDRYIIKEFNMTAWYDNYEEKLISLLNRSLYLM